MRINACKRKVKKITKKETPFRYDYHICETKVDLVSLRRDQAWIC